jgi:hypothetical protein
MRVANAAPKIYGKPAAAIGNAKRLGGSDHVNSSIVSVSACLTRYQSVKF